MKRFLTFAAISCSFLLAGALLQSVRAETLMTEAHISKIRTNCVDAQSTLRQLHASDALLRVNRGQLYELMSTKLMVPLNSRIALNRLDGLQLVSMAATYETQLASFRTSYQLYEESMSSALKMNCVNQPVAFYDRVVDARTKRKEVHTATLALHKTIQDYKNEFELFAKKNGGTK